MTTLKLVKPEPEAYLVSVNYVIQQGQTLVVPASDEKEAEQFAREILAGTKDIKIINITKASDVKGILDVAEKMGAMN